jgi:transposase
MNYCGIDVAKRKHSAMVINARSETVKQHFTFKNDRQGFDTLFFSVYVPQFVSVLFRGQAKNRKGLLG